MERQAFFPHKNPKAIGPYSPAIKAGGLIFCSGQIPLDLNSGELITSSIEDMTKAVLNQLNNILEEAGVSLRHVVKTTIFLTDLTHFEKVNQIYQTFFEPPYPARSTVEVSKLPKNSLIEIEAVAIM